MLSVVVASRVVGGEDAADVVASVVVAAAELWVLDVVVVVAILVVVAVVVVVLSVVVRVVVRLVVVLVISLDSPALADVNGADVKSASAGEAVALVEMTVSWAVDGYTYIGAVGYVEVCAVFVVVKVVGVGVRVRLLIGRLRPGASVRARPPKDC